MMRRTIGVVAIAVVALLSSAAIAGAQQTSQNGTVGGSNTNPAPGETITISGTGCPPSSSVGFAFDGSANGGTTAGANGNFSGPFTVPGGATGGTHTITASCGAQVLAFSVTVQGAAATTTTAVAAAAIPRTGTSSTVPLASIALALLAVGGLFVLFARRRRTGTAAV